MLRFQVLERRAVCEAHWIWATLLLWRYPSVLHHTRHTATVMRTETQQKRLHCHNDSSADVHLPKRPMWSSRYHDHQMQWSNKHQCLLCCIQRLAVLPMEGILMRRCRYIQHILGKYLFLSQSQCMHANLPLSRRHLLSHLFQISSLRTSSQLLCYLLAFTTREMFNTRNQLIRLSLSPLRTMLLERQEMSTICRSHSHILWRLCQRLAQGLLEYSYTLKILQIRPRQP